MGRTGLYPETVAALARHFPVAPEIVDVSASDSSYFELLKRSWNQGRDLILVEHDIVVHSKVWSAFRYCPRSWCAFPYEMSVVVQPGLGCTRFRASLMAREAGVWAEVARHGNDSEIPDGLPSKHWLRLDVRLDAELMPRDHQPHVHWPQVEHLNAQQRFDTRAPIP